MPHAANGYEGDTLDFEIHDMRMQGTPITQSEPPDTLTWEIYDQTGLLDSGNIADFFYVTTDPADPFWRVTIPLPLNQEYSKAILRATKGAGVKTWKIPILVDTVL